MQLSLLDIADRYPHSPGHKVDGTSRDAAESIKPTAATLRARALVLVERAGARGLTADECAAGMGVSVLAVRPRFSELYAMGRVVKSGARRENASGRDANVWIAIR